MNLLVPMDDSEHAADALAYAFETHPEAAVTVVHVVGVPSMMMGGAVGLALEEDFDRAAADLAEPVFERAREIAAEHGRDIETEVAVGHPVRSIVRASEGFDAIVIGSHGVGRGETARRVLIGNVATGVVSRADVPVTVVR